MLGRLMAVVLIAASAAVACGGAPAPSRTLEPGELPGPLAGLPVTTAVLAGRELDVVVADTPGARARGLMGVADLGTFEGMVFVAAEPVQTAFHMQDVPIPLDIAFIGPDGLVLAVLAMPRCASEPCPAYRSPAPFRWALETPAGGLRGVVAGDRLELRPWTSASGVASR